MKKATSVFLIVLVLLFAGFFAVLILPWPKPDSAELLDKYILNPTPEGTVIRELFYFNPSLGDGEMVLELTVTEEGMKALMERYEWEPLEHFRAAYLLHAYRVIDENSVGDLFSFELSEFCRVEIFRKDHQTVLLGADI